MGLKISSNWITSQKPDKAYDTTKWEKDSWDSWEHCSSEGLRRSTLLTMPMSASRAMVPPGYILWTAVELCKCSISFRYVIFQNC